jgi:hypothetical protein
MIRAEFLVSHWGTGWLMSHHECQAALAGLDRALAAADASGSGSDVSGPETDGPGDADVQAGIGE